MPYLFICHSIEPNFSSFRIKRRNKKYMYGSSILHGAILVWWFKIELSFRLLHISNLLLADKMFCQKNHQYKNCSLKKIHKKCVRTHTFIIMRNHWRNKDLPSIQVDLNSFFFFWLNWSYSIYFSRKRVVFLNSASRQSKFSKEIQSCEPFVLMNLQTKWKKKRNKIKECCKYMRINDDPFRWFQMWHLHFNLNIFHNNRWVELTAHKKMKTKKLKNCMLISRTFIHIFTLIKLLFNIYKRHRHENVPSHYC